MFEILKSLLAGTPFEGFLKLFSSLFGDSETVENQQDTNGDSLPSNEPNSQGGATASTPNEDFNLEDIWKKVEDIFGGGANSNASSEPENGEIEPPTEPEMEPDEPEIEPNEPKTEPKLEPTPTKFPEPISAPEPEAQPMPSVKELEEASKSLGKDADNIVLDDEPLGFEPENEADKQDSNSKPTNEEDSLGFEPETEGNDIVAAEPKKPKEDDSLGFEPQ